MPQDLIDQFDKPILFQIMAPAADIAKYTGPRTFTDKKTLGPVKPVSFYGPIVRRWFQHPAAI